MAGKVNLCIEKYASAHKGKFPEIAVVTSKVYELLEQSNLILPSLDLNQARALLKNIHDEPVEIYRTDEKGLPEDIKMVAEEIAMGFPLSFYRTNWRERIKRSSMDSFNLEATASELALV